MSPLTSWQPPADYVPVDSALAGISVYAPRAAEQEAEAAALKPVSFKCPNCGGTTKYDVAAGGVACEYCGHVAQARAAVVGHAAAQNEFTLEALNKAEKGWGVDRQELHCETCGADIALTSEAAANRALTATCPFCASNNVNVRAAQTDSVRPRFLVPFKIKPEDTQAKARAWLGQGWFHPGDLASAANINRFVGVYLPFWTFAAHIGANWRAEVGYERSESYYDSEDKEWKTRTVIDWRWESGQVPVPINDWLTPGTSHVSNLLLASLNPFQLNDLATYTPDYLAGWQAQAYDVTLPKAWEIGKAAMRETAKDAARRSISSSHVRNFSMAAEFSDESWRYVLLPVYLTAYKFQDKVFQVMVNGQTGKVAGQKPVAWWKIWAVIALALSPGLCGGLISLPLLLLTGPGGLVALIIATVFFIIGVVVSVGLFMQANRSDKA